MNANSNPKREAAPLPPHASLPTYLTKDPNMFLKTAIHLGLATLVLSACVSDEQRARRALDAVESLVAEVRFRHVAASESDASRAVGQLRSDALVAVVDARGGGSSTTVLVSLATKRAS